MEILDETWVNNLLIDDNTSIDNNSIIKSNNLDHLDNNNQSNINNEQQNKSYKNINKNHNNINKINDTVENNNDTIENDNDIIKNDNDTFENDNDTIENDNDTIENDNDTIENDNDTIENDNDTNENYEDINKNNEENINKWIKKSFPKNINIYFIYISKNLLINKIINEKVDLYENGLLKKELLLYLIQNNKKKYKLKDILLYRNNIDTIDHNFNNKLNNSNFLKLLPNINNINFDEQILLFHSLNSIYIILNENDEQVEIINGVKIIKRIPHKKYTRKIKYFNDISNKDILPIKDNKTRKKVSFVE